MSDDKKTNSDSLTPLQRYLAKQKEAQGATSQDSESSLEKVSALEGGAPAAPAQTSSPSPVHESAGGGQGTDQVKVPQNPIAGGAIEPAGFWIRFFAAFIDGLIVACGSTMISMFFKVALFFLPYTFIQMIVQWALVFFYFGWFYAERGGTPGKLLFNLEVIETGTGRRLGYWRTFFRETVGKLLSSIIFLIGYIMAGVRSDKKALHDLIFDTRVIRKRIS